MKPRIVSFVSSSDCIEVTLGKDCYGIYASSLFTDSILSTWNPPHFDNLRSLVGGIAVSTVHDFIVRFKHFQFEYYYYI